MKFIAISIAVHNRLDLTKKCIQSILNATKKHRLHFYVVDDGSTDGTSEWITENHPRIKLIKGNGNLWFGGATFLSLKYIFKSKKKYDYILIINNDTFLNSGSIDNLVELSKNKYVVGSLYKQENINELGSSGFIWKFKKGLEGVSYTKKWDQLSKSTNYLKVDSVSTTSTLFPIKYLKGFNQIPIERHPHHRFDIMLAASSKKLGANFIVTTKIMATHNYTNNLNINLSWRKQSINEFVKSNLLNPLDVSYLPGRIESNILITSIRESWFVNLKIISGFVFRFIVIIIKNLIIFLITPIKKLIIK